MTHHSTTSRKQRIKQVEEELKIFCKNGDQDYSRFIGHIIITMGLSERVIKEYLSAFKKVGKIDYDVYEDRIEWRGK